MKIHELIKSKVPIVRIDKSLEQHKDKILFAEKLAKTNEMLKNRPSREKTLQLTLVVVAHRQFKKQLSFLCEPPDLATLCSRFL